jgi:hypothetical protein
MMNRRRTIVLIGAILVVFIGLLAWREWRANHEPPAAVAAADSTQAGVRSVTLWFADLGGDSLIAESRDLVEQEGLHERVTALVAALDQGPIHRGLPTLPPGTAALHVYMDDRGMLTLDLSRAFQQGFKGGSRAEEMAVGSLVRTIGSNIPEARRVLLVCNGTPMVSLGGHVPLDLPLEVHDWY